MSSRHCNLEPLGRWHATIYMDMALMAVVQCQSMNLSLKNQTWQGAEV